MLIESKSRCSACACLLRRGCRVDQVIGGGVCVAFDPSEGGCIIRASWWLTEDVERVSRIMAQRPDVEDQLCASPGQYASPVLPCTHCRVCFYQSMGQDRGASWLRGVHRRKLLFIFYLRLSASERARASEGESEPAEHVFPGISNIQQLRFSA